MISTISLIILILFASSCNNEELFTDLAQLQEEDIFAPEDTAEGFLGIVLENDRLVTAKNRSVKIDMFANDKNIPKGKGKLSRTEPSSGDLTVDDNDTPLDMTDDTLLYTPDSDFVGEDSFEYSVESDTIPSQNVPTATVTINVKPTNDESSTELKAFPGAYGAAAYITGGRNGSVYHVTNLNNSGTGSFRDAVSTSNRIIVFDVSGTIDIATSLQITADNLTIAGQTAPLGGVALTGLPIEFNTANNIILRYVRFRPTYNDSGSVDALNIVACDNFIIDHCSISWGGDEAVSIIGDSDIWTFSNNIMGESATGMLAGDSNSFISSDISILGNLWYNISHRFPNVNASRIDVINNVVHNWNTRLMVVSAHDNVQLNELGNYYQPGTKTQSPTAVLQSLNWLDIGSSSQRTNIRVYTDGNVYTSFLTETGDDWTLYVHRFNVTSGAYSGTNQGDSGHIDFKALSQFSLLGEAPNVTSATDAFTNVTTNAGANKYLDGSGVVYTDWDSIDDTYLSNTIAGTSETYTYPPTDIVSKQSYIDYQAAISSTPINSRDGNYDTDNDGMPDVWEKATFGDLSKDGRGDTDGDGYTDLEEFLNSVDK